jgi:hypothetical protein
MMRLQIAILAASMMGLMLMGAVSAKASLAPDDMVGRWSAQQGCQGNGDFAYIGRAPDLQQVISDGQREYRTPVNVKIVDGLLRVHMDEKVYTFRLSAPDRLEALQYTDSRTGLTASFSPRTWFRCS